MWDVLRNNFDAIIGPLNTEARWGVLPAPIFAADNEAMSRAQSLLTGEMLAGEVCPPLTPDQARCVLRWAGEMK